MQYCENLIICENCGYPELQVLKCKMARCLQTTYTVLPAPSLREDQPLPAVITGLASHLACFLSWSPGKSLHVAIWEALSSPTSLQKPLQFNFFSVKSFSKPVMAKFTLQITTLLWIFFSYWPLYSMAVFLIISIFLANRSSLITAFI